MQMTNVLEYLENTAARLPDKVAYEGADSALTFAQVSNAARGVGSALLEKGYTREPVVVFMKKSPEAIAAFFGCVYAGCFYVPIDTEMPRLRIDMILENLQPRAMLCDESTLKAAQALDFHGDFFLYSAAGAHEIDEKALCAVRDSQIDTDPIYIVFTSGSTGVPKGVVACHRSVIDYIENLSEVLDFSQETRFGLQSPLYFDACLKELYPTLKFGASTVIIPKQLFMFPVRLVEFLNEKGVNTVCWVVSALTMISSTGALEKTAPNLTNIAFGSEVFPIKQFRLWRRALPSARFTNLYGPTETTGMCCYFKVEREFELDEAIPIGRPFKNTEILLLTEQNTLAKDGEVGEICVRGTSLTLGYHRAFAKTAEAFVQNPLNDRYPELIYRTGDLGRRNERGELVFVSRKDYQIKHMGHRIELGEIEVNCNLQEGVRMSACIYDQEKGKIVLFYTGAIEPGDLSKKLRERLPRYMLPNVVNKLPAIPLTPNGKIDRVGLKTQYERKES